MKIPTAFPPTSLTPRSPDFFMTGATILGSYIEADTEAEAAVEDEDDEAPWD